MVTRIEQAETAVTAVRAMLSELEGLGRAGTDEFTSLLARCAEISRLVDAQQVRLAAELVERSNGPVGDSVCRRMGHRSPRSALAEAFGMRGRQASDLLMMAAATTAGVALTGGTIDPRYPAVARALDEGSLSLPQAQSIVQVLEPAVPRADLNELAWAEQTLVTAATDPAEPLVPELLTVQGRAYAALLDPDGVLPNAERQRAMRSLRTGVRRDGMWQTVIISPPEEGSALKATLDAHDGPRTPVRFHDPDAPAEEGADAAPLVDDRTRPQRQHDVMMGMVRAHAGSDDAPTAGGEAPTLVFTGTIEAYQAYVEGATHRERTLTIQHTGEVVPMETVGRLLCDARVQIAVTDERGHVLELGREQRLFNRAQRRALALRDGGCRGPGCRMPAAWCEAHHVVPWQIGGPTDVDFGILVCNYHHHEIHAGRLRVERAGPRPGQWRVVSQLRPVRTSGPFIADVLEAALTAGAEEQGSCTVSAGAAAGPTMRLPDQAAVRHRFDDATASSTDPSEWVSDGGTAMPRPPCATSGEPPRADSLERSLRRRVSGPARRRFIGPRRSAPRILVDHHPAPRIIMRT